MSVKANMLAGFLAGATAAGFAQERPNILLMVFDDMGFSDLGCFGGDTHTPNIDRLAQNGLRFSNFHNAGKCDPSGASILSGLFHIRQSRFEHLREAGLISKDWKLPPRPASIPAWESMPPEEQAFEARRMAVYAAMIEEADMGRTGAGKKQKN